MRQVERCCEMLWWTHRMEFDAFWMEGRKYSDERERRMQTNLNDEFLARCFMCLQFVAFFSIFQNVCFDKAQNEFPNKIAYSMWSQPVTKISCQWNMRRICSITDNNVRAKHFKMPETGCDLSKAHLHAPLVQKHSNPTTTKRKMDVFRGPNYKIHTSHRDIITNYSYFICVVVAAGVQCWRVWNARSNFTFYHFKSISVVCQSYEWKWKEKNMMRSNTLKL